MPHEIHPYLTISREAAAGGTEVARRVADKMGWEMFDSARLDDMIINQATPRSKVEFVDLPITEQALQDSCNPLDPDPGSESAYVTCLRQTALQIVHHASSVFVGRGIQFLLPREHGLSIRIVTPVGQRIDYSAQVRQRGREEAEEHVLEVDDNRRNFVRRLFQQKVEEATLYDLVINMENLSVDQAAKLIVSQCDQKFRL